MENINLDLATSQPRTLTVGFPLFPSDTSLGSPALPQRIGEAGESNTLRVLRGLVIRSGTFTIRPFFNLTLTATKFEGFNLQYSLTGQTRTDGTGFLRVRNDAAEGGIGAGLNLRADLGIAATSTRRNPPPRRVAAFNQATDFNIDLLAIVIRVVGALSGIQVPPEILAGSRSSRANGERIYGLFDRSENVYESSGVIRLQPRFSASPDIAKYIPKVGPVLKKLKKIGVKLTFGPQINFIFPIRIRIVQLRTLDGTYTVGAGNASPPGTELLFGGPSGPVLSNITEGQVFHEHTIGFLVTIGVFFSLKFIGISIFSRSITTPVNFGPRRNPNLSSDRLLGPYVTRLTTNDPPIAKAELPEVVWG